MCGITGAFAFSKEGQPYLDLVESALGKLNKRGPDAQHIYSTSHCKLGHARLSILDISNNANQPMTDLSNRYTIVFNGEIFNYQTLQEQYLKNQPLKSTSDTEVLLYLYILLGEELLPLLNGFFAFAIYDNVKNSLFIARDRYGEKPLSYFFDSTVFIFGSEQKSVNEYNLDKILDYNTLYQYFQLNYVAAPDSMLKGIKKLEAGHCIHIKDNSVVLKQWYHINTDILPAYKNDRQSYSVAKNILYNLMDEAVQLRLLSDVPLGAFLSGGIDSSVVVALASKHVNNLNTFSIGYKDEPFFDETSYANLVATKYKTNHHVFKLSNDDLLAELMPMLDYLDEPFADSSSLAVYILSKETRKYVTVALSGDGADELFGGYHKHMGEYKIAHAGILSKAIAALLPLWEVLPKSRQSPLTNIIRQLSKFSQGIKLSPKERYWKFCSISSPNEVTSLLSSTSRSKIDFTQFEDRLSNLTFYASQENKLGINNTLLNDVQLVLQNDMLPKVDLMSMAHSLEVRSPFLDHKVVDFAFSIPECYKIDQKHKKKIVQDAFREILPPALYHRPKKGFEVPLLKWMQGELKPYLWEVLNDDFIMAQGIFEIRSIQALKQKLFSNNPEDVHAKLWALLVFQHWWNRNFKIA